jgi:hypothetical protein
VLNLASPTRDGVFLHHPHATSHLMDLVQLHDDIPDTLEHQQLHKIAKILRAWGIDVKMEGDSET